MNAKPNGVSWRIGRLMCGLAFAVGSVAGHAQQPILPPTDTDLKAAYCIAAKQTFLGDLRNILPGIENAHPGNNLGIPQDALRDLLETRDHELGELKHLQRYLLPRLRFVDAGGIHAAMEQAKQDMSDTDSSGVSACTRNCALTLHGGAAGEACVKACDPDAFSRLWACKDLSWLPF